MSENYFLSRKSCRNFSSVPLPLEKIKDIITQAVKAPTCGNMQLYSVIVTRDENNLRKLAAQHFNQPAASSAPCILTICADFNRFTRWCELNDAKADYKNFHSFIMAATDAIILAQQIVTIAERQGLGTCYLGSVTYNAKEISDLLKLPEMVVPVASLAIGMPEKEGEITRRLSTDTIIHSENYRNDSDDDILNFFDIHTSDPTNDKFIKENNKKNLAQVFSEVRYPGELQRSLSESFLNLLKEKKFFNS